MAEKTAEELAAEQVAAEAAAQKKADEKAAAELERYIKEERKTLTRMVRDGEEVYVHPTTIDAHKAVGYKVAPVPAK